LNIYDKECTAILDAVEIGSELIATSSDDTSIKIWNYKKGVCVQQLVGNTQQIHTLCQIKSEELLASGTSGKNSVINIWNIRNGSNVRTLKGHGDTITSIATISDDLLVTGSQDTTIRIWQWKQGKCRRVLHGHQLSVITVQALGT
jgi:WD40 repeat protein